MKIPKLSCTFASTIEKTHEDNVSPFSTFPLDTLLRKSAKEAFYYRKATGSYQKGTDRKSTRLNSSHTTVSRMPSSA